MADIHCMRAQLRDRREEHGFTLIELLVVMIIIAILASIAIPIYLNQREKAWMSQIQSGLKNAAIGVESYALGEPDGYLSLDGQSASALAAEGFQMPDWTAAPGYMTIEATRTTFCIQARHANLSANSAWRRSIFNVANGQPTAVPDTCPSL